MAPEGSGPRGAPAGRRGSVGRSGPGRPRSRRGIAFMTPLSAGSGLAAVGPFCRSSSNSHATKKAGRTRADGRAVCKGILPAVKERYGLEKIKCGEEEADVADEARFP